MCVLSYLASFDSATAMLRFLVNFLHGRDFPLLSTSREPLMLPVAALVNALPVVLREQIYIWCGWSEAIAATKLAEASMERIAEWAVNPYPGENIQRS